MGGTSCLSSRKKPTSSVYFTPSRKTASFTSYCYNISEQGKKSGFSYIIHGDSIYIEVKFWTYVINSRYTEDFGNVNEFPDNLGVVNSNAVVSCLFASRSKYSFTALESVIITILLSKPLKHFKKSFVQPIGNNCTYYRGRDKRMCKRTRLEKSRGSRGEHLGFL